MLVPALAQSVAAADGRVGTPLNAPAVSTAAYVPNYAIAGARQYRPATCWGRKIRSRFGYLPPTTFPDKPAQIDNDGTVTLPMIGQVHAAGLTVEQLQANLVTAYKKYFKDPQVTVQVNDFRSQPVSVAGNVNTPGVVQLRGNRNLMEVIGQAGGLRADAGDSVLITRNLSEGPIPVAGAFTDPTGKYTVAHIDIRAVMSGKDPRGQHHDQAARRHHRSPRAHGLRAGQRRPGPAAMS